MIHECLCRLFNSRFYVNCKGFIVFNLKFQADYRQVRIVTISDTKFPDTGENRQS